MKVEKRCVCPYPGNYDCICRQGDKCGGYIVSGKHLTKCPFYIPLSETEINHIETKLINICEGCRDFGKVSCNESTCDYMRALCVLEALKVHVKSNADKTRYSNKTSSGFTYPGKDN